METNTGYHLAPGGDDHLQVVDTGVVLKDHALVLQPAGQRQDEGLELVVAGEAQTGQIGEPGEVLKEAVHVPLHLGEGLVLLEGEHRLEQRVEVRGEEIGVEPVLDAFAVGHFLLGHQKLDDCVLPFLVQPHLVGVPTMPTVVDHPAGIDVGIVLVNSAELVKDGVGLGHLQRRDLTHDVPEALEVLAHLPAPTSNEALVGVPGAVK